jgi:hypothetical protein
VSVDGSRQFEAPRSGTAGINKENPVPFSISGLYEGPETTAVNPAASGVKVERRQTTHDVDFANTPSSERALYLSQGRISLTAVDLSLADSPGDRIREESTG